MVFATEEAAETAREEIASARRLSIEQLEHRRMLAAGQIFVSGYVQVSNLENSMNASGNVPVQGIHIHAWVGSSTLANSTAPGVVHDDIYTSNLGYYMISLIDPNGITVGETIHIVAIAQSNGANGAPQYQVIKPVVTSTTSGQNNYSLKPNLAYTSQFDDTVTSTFSLLGTPTFIDSSHNDTLSAPSVVNGNLPAPENTTAAQQTALAFTAFSLMGTPYAYATTIIHAALAPQIYVVMPWVQVTPSGESGEAIGTNEILLQNKSLEAPDVIAHEFGHLVAARGGFVNSAGNDATHFAAANERTMPPTTAAGATPTGAINAVDLAAGWNEGFADYYSVASKAAIDPTWLNIPSLAGANDKTYFFGNVTGFQPEQYRIDRNLPYDPENNPQPVNGWGEDNEVSVMRILWDVKTQPGNSDAALYRMLSAGAGSRSSPIMTLSALWNLLMPAAGNVNQQTAALGKIFQAGGVPPVALQPKGKTLYFEVPDLHQYTAAYQYVGALTFSTITLQLFGANYSNLGFSVTATLAPGTGDNAGKFTITSTASGTFAQVSPAGSNGAYTEFSYTLSAADVQKVRATGPTDTTRYFVVEGSSTTADTGVATGPYWSDGFEFTVKAPEATGMSVPATENVPVTEAVATLAGIWPSDESTMYATVAWSNGTYSSQYNQANGGITFSTDDGVITATVNASNDLPLGLYSIRTTFFLGGQLVDGVLTGGEDYTTVDSLATVSAATLSVTVPSGLTFYKGLPDDQTVATFTDASGATDASLYTALVNYGDGRVAPGSVSYNISTQQFDVSANDMDVYDTAGTEEISVTVTGAGGATASAGPQSASVLPDTLLGWGQQVVEPSNQVLSSVLVGTFVDPAGSDDVDDYSALATITGEYTGGTITQACQIVYNEAENDFSVYLSCTLPDPTANSISVDVTEDGVTVYGLITSGASVSWPDSAQSILASTGGYVQATVGEAPSSPWVLATFTVNDPDATASDFVATADFADSDTGGDVWGIDPSVSVVAEGGGTFDVVGSCVYPVPGQNWIDVQVTQASDYPEFGFSSWATATISDAAVDVSPLTNVPAIANVPLDSAAVATFTDGNPYETSPGDFQAVIIWQSGYQTMGTVSYDSTTGLFTVSGSYAYASVGTKSVEVDVYDAYGTVAGTTDSSVSVTDGALTPTPEDIVTDGSSAVLVGQVSAQNPAAIASDFIVTSSWGAVQNGYVVPADGNDDGVFDVYATISSDYTGNAGANSSLQITVTEDSGQTGSATTTITDTSLTLGGDATFTLGSLPAVSVTIAGATVDLNGQSVDLGSNTLSVESGTITDGSLAGAIIVQGGEADVNLSGAFTFAGNGYATLTGSNSFSSVSIGSSPYDTGTLAVGPGSLGSGTVTFVGNSTLLASSDMTLTQSIVTPSLSDSGYQSATIDTGGYTVNLTGDVSGPSDLIQTDVGTLGLNGTNTGLEGDLVVNGGFIAAGSMSNFGDPDNSALVFNGGGLQWTSQFNISSDMEIDVQAGGATFDTNSYSVIISAALGTTYSGDAAGGITVMDNSSAGTGVLTLSGSNLYQDGTDVESGSLVVGSADALGTSPAPLTVDGGELDLGGYGLTVTSLSGAGGTITNNAASTTTTLTVDQGSDSTDYTFLGNIQDGMGAVALTTAGYGTLTLYGANAFSGTINVGANSTLAVGDGAIPNVNVTDDGTLAFANAGNDTFSGDISGSGSVSMIGTGTEDLSGDNSFSDGASIVAGMLAFDNADSLPLTPSTASILIGGSAALEAPGWETVTELLDSSVISTSSTGAVALPSDSSENIDMSGYASLNLGAAANVNYTGTLMPADDTYMLGGGPGVLTMNTVLADGDDGPASAVINGSVVFAAANTYSGGTTVNNGTLSLANAAALSGSGTATVTGPNSELQCTVAALIAGNVVLNAGGSLDAGSGSEVAGTLTVTSVVDGTRTYVASSWIGTSGTVDGEVVIEDGGILNVGVSCPATLIAPSGVLVIGSGQLLTPNVNSTIDGTVDFEGWQTTSAIVGQITGSASALIVGADTDYMPAITLGNIDGIGAVNDYGGGTYVLTGTLIVMSSGGIPTGSLLVVGNADAFGITVPALSQDDLGGDGDAMLRGGGGALDANSGNGDGAADDGPPDGWAGALPTSDLAPTVTEVQFDGPPIVNANVLTYTVGFSEPVNGVVAGDFSVVASGATAAIASVTAADNGQQYTVVINVSDSGIVQLLLASGSSIANAEDTQLYAPDLPITSAAVTVNPTLYWSGSGNWSSGQWTLADGAPTAWIDGSSIVVAAGSDLQLAGTVHVGSIEFQGAATITGGTIVLAPLQAGEGSSTIIVDSSVAVIDSAISGASDLAKQGDGVLIVNGAMSYTGGTSVAAGLLEALMPLPSAASVTGGQAIVVGSVLATDTAFAALDPALTTLTDTLYARDGSITRADMMQILDSAVVDNAVSDDAEAVLEGLTTTAAAAELGEPNYVAVLAADVVDGNAANSNYLGTALGNFAIQTSDAMRATALTDLVDKWFLGTDLPAIPSWASYSVTAGSLYGSAGTPSFEDAEQGDVGDCYLVAAVGSIADADPSAIENMFIDNGDGTYTVRFFYESAGQFVPDYVTVNSQLPGFVGTSTPCFAGAGPNGAFWVALLEKAYAQWNQTGHEGRDGTNNYMSLAGGWMDMVDEQVLGSSASDFLTGNSDSEQAVINAVQSGAAVTVGTFTDGSPTFSSLNLVSSHAYAITGFNASTGTFQLENPWGFDEPQPVTWAELEEFAPIVTVAGGAAGGSGPPVGAPSAAAPTAALSAASRPTIDAALSASVADAANSQASMLASDARTLALDAFFAEYGR